MKVAIVHYWWLSNRGGEGVVAALSEMYPQADLFLHVCDEALVRKTLEERFPQEIAPLPIRFQPHLTIGLFDDAAALAEARARVEAELKPMTFLVDRIFYSTQMETGQWWVRDYVQIGKA